MKLGYLYTSTVLSFLVNGGDASDASDKVPPATSRILKSGDVRVDFCLKRTVQLSFSIEHITLFHSLTMISLCILVQSF